MSGLLVAKRKVFKEDAHKLGEASRNVCQKLDGQAEVKPLASWHVLKLVWEHEYEHLTVTSAGDINGLSQEEILDVVGEGLKQSPTALSDLKAIPTMRSAFFRAPHATLAGYIVDAPAVISERQGLTTTLDELNGSLEPSAWSHFCNIVPVAIISQEDRGDPDILEALEEQRPETISFQPLKVGFI